MEDKAIANLTFNEKALTMPLNRLCQSVDCQLSSKNLAKYMSEFRLFLEKDGTTFILNPTQEEYIIGSSTDCQIHWEGMASKQLKFSFSYFAKRWDVYNLDQSVLVYIDNAPLTEIPIPITNQVRILVGNSTTFVARYEGSDVSIVQLQNSGLETSHSSNLTEVIELEKLTEKRYINRNLFDKEDPSELRGTWLKNFSFSFNRSLGVKAQSKLVTLRKDLYEGVCKKLEEFQKQDAYLNAYLSFKVIRYIDYKYQDDRERLYIEIIRNTIRGAKITTLLRFFVNGDNLYLAADSYALGELKKRKMIFHSILLLFFILLALNPFVWVFIVSLLFIPAFLSLWYLYSAWIELIRALSQGEPFLHALRLNFPKNIKGNAFDLDDISMFLKSIYPLIIFSLEETLGKNDLLDEDLRTILENIRDNIGQSSININTDGGNIIGGIIGGISNVINNQSVTK